MRATLLLVPALLAVGCGSRQFAATQPATAPFRTFGRVVVEEFSVDGAERLPLDQKGRALNVAHEIGAFLRERIADRGLFPGEGRTLVIRGTLVGFDEGSQALRYFVGFGAGKGEIIADVSFADEDGKTVARGNSRGTVSGGWFGGSTRSASRRVAKAVVDFIEDHYEAAGP